MLANLTEGYSDKKLRWQPSRKPPAEEKPTTSYGNQGRAHPNSKNEANLSHIWLN